jgi:hemerythrin-like domain-containing protein
MQKQHQPIKRSRQLAALSREHHEGLLFVWKIKQGIAFGVPAKRISRYCAWFWQNILKDHFAKEEAALSSLLPASDVLLNTMVEDHQAIFEKMEQVIDDASYYSLQRLGQIIYYHIRFEERSLFTHIEQTVPAEKLEQAVKILSVTPIPATPWDDEFWIKKPKANLFETSTY